MSFERLKGGVIPESTRFFSFWTVSEVTAEYPATSVHLIYMGREAFNISRHNALDAFLIQWQVNEWQGILKFSPVSCNPR